MNEIYISRDRISREDMYYLICKVVAQRSTCFRSQVGAIIVKDGRIISTGYNGPISGQPACTMEATDQAETLRIQENQIKDPITRGIFQKILWSGHNKCMGPGCTRSIHAETNAIAFAARAGVSIEGGTVYCSMSPCINCAKLLVNSGIRKLYYFEEYRDTSGVELLKSAGVEVELLRIDSNELLSRMNWG